ncbi:MAG TPA: shikimate kinase [Planctomycetota bacterium]|nr:shikimate kinase [Planctomycetota bacterium]
MNLILIGLRGTGKSTVGKILAARLNWPFYDTDTIVQDRAGLTIKELFEQKGEPEFRRLESEVVQECAAFDTSVIATGGGAILNETNVSALRRNGFVVHLSANPAELWRRISLDAATNHTRPKLLQSAETGIEELEKLLLSRAAKYAAARHSEVIVEDRTPDEVVERVLVLMKAHKITK